MANKISKNKNRFLGLLILLVVVISIVLIKFVSSNSKNDKIKSITLSEKCVASINLKSGKSETIDIKTDVISKECNVKPVVSKDGKYAAFDLSLVIKDLDQKSGKSANNSSIVYLLDSDKWINVYNHGASESTSISFNENNDLVVYLRYEGKDIDSWIIKSSDFEKIIKAEEELVLSLVKQQKEVSSWLKKFDSKTYQGRDEQSKAVVEIDRYIGDEIVIHAYEQFTTDGHRATFNWYSYNRLSLMVAKVF